MKHLVIISCILFSFCVEWLSMAVLACWVLGAAGKALALSAGKF